MFINQPPARFLDRFPPNFGSDQFLRLLSKCNEVNEEGCGPLPLNCQQKAAAVSCLRLSSSSQNHFWQITFNEPSVAARWTEWGRRRGWWSTAWCRTWRAAWAPPTPATPPQNYLTTHSQTEVSRKPTQFTFNISSKVVWTWTLWRRSPCGTWTSTRATTMATPPTMASLPHPCQREPSYEIHPNIHSDIKFGNLGNCSDPGRHLCQFEMMSI